MRYRKLGNTDVDVSVVGLGCWVMGGSFWGGAEDADSIRAIEASVDSGVNLIDTAPVYGFGHSEEVVGKAIKGKRDQVLIATKCGLNWAETKGEYYFSREGKDVYRNLNPDSLRGELEASLRRLGTDCIDLYQTHWQTQSTPVEETMAGLMRMREEGKIRFIGVSNAGPKEMDAYRAVGEIVSNQPHYSLMRRNIEADILPYCVKNNLTVLAYSPIAQGLLTGKITPGRSFPDDDVRSKNPWIRDHDALNRLNATLEKVFRPIADAHGATLAQIAIAWVTSQPGEPVALCGARRPDQAIANAGAGSIILSPEECKAMAEAIEALEPPKV